MSHAHTCSSWCFIRCQSKSEAAPARSLAKYIRAMALIYLPAAGASCHTTVRLWCHHVRYIRQRGSRPSRRVAHAGDADRQTERLASSCSLPAGKATSLDSPRHQSAVSVDRYVKEISSLKVQGLERLGIVRTGALCPHLAHLHTAAQLSCPCCRIQQDLQWQDSKPGA